MPHAVVDADFIKYAAAAVGEKRTIQVVHRQSGDEWIYKTRTDFWGHWLKKSGGDLAKMNQGRETPLLPEEFDITDIQTPEPVEHSLHLAKVMFDKCLRLTNADTFTAYMGKGDSFRVDKSTILKYKGQREDMLRPLHLDAVGDYLHRTFGAEYITGIEADDQCVIDCVEHPASILVGIDKDYYGSPVQIVNPDKPEWGLVDCRGFGGLYVDEKGVVRGNGRMFLYHQVMYGDKTDNYCANSASDMKWGEKSSYALLKDCKTDREAWEALVKGYKKLYPEPKVITGWRGDEIEVDWLYVLRENFTMARMLRWEGDEVDAKDVLTKMGLL